MPTDNNIQDKATILRADELRLSPPPAPSECRRAATVATLVTAVAETAPDAVALCSASARMTYGELNSRATRLAEYLKSLGAGPEVAVGICLERSFDQIIAAFAVLKSGGAYVPLDPAWPLERLRSLLKDVQAPIVITSAPMAQDLGHDGHFAVVPDRDAKAIASFDAHAAPVRMRRKNLAYIIYTSGSTGEPKGVEITHGNLLNLVFWHRRAFGVTAGDRASHLAGLGFDASVWEIWPYLTAGATVSLASEAVRTSPELLQRWLIDERINIAFVPTALAESMIAAEWPADVALQYLLTGADTLHTFPRPDLPFAVVNNYGPTECAVVATSGTIAPSSDIANRPSIGTPIANTNIYLLDERGEPVAQGETGEIYIGGTSVGRGYRNRPQLTGTCFVPDRFHSTPDARMYRTGDLGCRLPDGQIAFRGRIDNQEKIRGHRVEPDEIATALNRHPLIATSAVVARAGSDGEKQLVAYVVPAASKSPAPGELRAFLAERLPEYMIPSTFVRLASLPLTSSGKLDKNALPEPSTENSGAQAGYRAPATATELSLAAIVATVLGIEHIGADDNFFLMGGHSLLGTQVVMRARDAFGVDLTLRHLFEAPTVATLASVIEQLVIDKLETMTDAEAERQIAS